MNIYRPAQSILAVTLKQQASSLNQKIQFLEQSLAKAQRELGGVRFQQNHLKFKKQELLTNYEKAIKKIQKQIHELQEQMNQITLDEILIAFKTNEINDRIVIYLEDQPQNSKQKINLVRAILASEQKLNDYREQANMIIEDMNSLSYQSGVLALEYEELEEVIQSFEDIEPITKIYQIKKQLNDYRNTYLQISSQRSQLEDKLFILTQNLNQTSDILNQLRQENIQVVQNIGINFDPSIEFWLSADKVLNVFHEQFQSNKKEHIEEIYQIIISVHDKVVSCCISLLQKQLKFDERQKLFNSNYVEMNNILQQNSNLFKIIDASNFECLLTQKTNNQTFIQYIENKSKYFLAEIQKQIKIYSCTLEHTSLKAQQIELERQVHQFLYEQSMIHCNYQRLEQQLNQLKITGPILLMNTQTIQLEQILERINQIEFIQKKNKSQIELGFPKQLQIIDSQLLQTQNLFSQQIENLLSLSNKIQVVYSGEQQELFQKMELNQLENELLSINTNFQSEQSDIDQQLKQLNNQEINIQQNIETITQAMNDYNKKPLKENIIPSELHSKRNSLDQSVLTNKSQLKNSCYQENTDRSVSRSKSALGSHCNSLRNVLSLQSPQNLKKTKLTLINNSQKQLLNQSNLDETTILSPNKSFLSQNNQNQQTKLFKVYKRTITNTFVQKLSEVNNYNPKYVKFNEKMKCIEFYKVGNELNGKESALNIKQIQGIQQQIVKGVIKPNFTFFGLYLLLQKNQKIELLFGKQDELNQFLQFIK